MKDIINKKYHYKYTLIVIMSIGLFQGLSSLSDLAVSYLYKDNYKFSPSLSQSMQNLLNIPWIFKPVFGYISDTLPIFGYRRKSYLIFTNLLNFLSWVLMSFKGVSNEFFGIMNLLFNSTFLCFSSVIGEALLVELSRSEGEDLEEEEKS